MDSIGYEIIESSEKELLKSFDLKTKHECLDKMDAIDLKQGETIIVAGQDGEYEILTLEEDAILYDYACNYMFIITVSNKYYSINCEPAIVDYQELKRHVCDEGEFHNEWEDMKEDIKRHNITKYIVNPS